MLPSLYTSQSRGIAPANMTRRTLLLGIAVGTAFALAHKPARASAAGPRICFVNAILPATPLDIYIDGEVIDSAVPFGTSSKIQPMPTAAFDVAAVPPGAPIVAAVASRRMELDPTLTYEIAIFGEFFEGYLQAAEPPDTYIQEFGVVLMPLDPGTASLRFLHMAPDVPAVGYGLAADALFADDVIYPGATPYTSVTTAPVDLGIYTTEDSAQLLSLPGQEFTEGKAHSLYLVGRATDASLQTVIVSWWVERSGNAEAPAAPSSDETAYLTELQGIHGLVMQSMVNLDEVLMDGTFSGPYLNMLSWVCVGFVTAERELMALSPPERYAELHQSMLNAVTPLANGARAVSTAEEWLDDEADAVNFTTSDLTPLMQEVVNTLPALQQADAMLIAALEEAGIPAS